ncbi:hypothetical protein FPCIR_12955 [Fusarium pseudocircinatum]|uniref:Uncharacterized protein n=1 Tax=Fusarium pseudocircinatum TaxID=56676 RepID=A0A8H5KNU6_9HYPO|nr:hypothetical protein FPCIR_12955 [Fusarium pseudocircinatum]
MAPLMNFVGKKLVDLYEFDLEKIYIFLMDVADDPASFKIPDAESKKDRLRKIYRQMLTLCPLDKNDIDRVKNHVKAENYEPRKGNRLKGEIDKDFVPAQHIYRRQTGEQKPGTNTKPWAKIDVNLAPDWRHSYPYRPGVVELPYWSHYDLLGLFLSLMGPAQPNSDRYNFFLPLTAVYTRWAFIIGGSRNYGDIKERSLQEMAFTPKPGHGPPPTIFQCTWLEGSDGNVDFSLGASMGGHNYGNRQVLGDWGSKLQKTRFALLNDWNGIKDSEWKNRKGEMVKFAFEISPSIDGGRSTTKFGNCGETYPFVHMLGTYRETSGRKQVKGLALASAFLNIPALREAYSLQDILREENGRYKYLWAPCPNCRHLITVASAKLNNFLPKSNPPSPRDLEKGEGSKAKAEVKENGHLVSI